MTPLYITQADITTNGKPFGTIANTHTMFITALALRVDPQRTSDHEPTTGTQYPISFRSAHILHDLARTQPRDFIDRIP